MAKEKTAKQIVQGAAQCEDLAEERAGLYPEIVVTGRAGRPYFNIKYYDPERREWNIGYSSFDLQHVFDYLKRYFGMTVAEPSDYGEKLPDCHAANNADRVRAMRDWDLAAFWARRIADQMVFQLREQGYEPTATAVAVITERLMAQNLAWLKQPAEEEAKA